MGGLTVEAEVLERSGRRCCICFGLHQDLGCKRGQIAHLDHNHQNNDIDNLAFLCLEHHDEYDTRTSQSRGWTINEVKRYRDRLYGTIDGLRNTGKRNVTASVREYELPIFGRTPAPSRITMDAVDCDTGQDYHGVSAHPFLYEARLTFDVTNPNQFDMRIVRFYVDVIKYARIDIIGLREQTEYGGGMMVREFGCEIDPKIGSYECFQISQGFDYIKLSSGEMETFGVNIGAVAEGIYWLRLGMEYSIGGETRKIEADNCIQEMGVYDPVFHEPSRSWEEEGVGS